MSKAISGEPVYDALACLLGATYQQAIKDAKRGELDAIYFLDVCCPDWRKSIEKSLSQIHSPQRIKSNPK